MSDDYLWDRGGAVDPEVARLEELLAPMRHDAPLRRRRPVRVIVVATVGALAAAIAIYLALPRERACSGGAGFAFAGKGGEVSCSGHAVAAGVLPVGGQLDTGAHAADLTIATIGHAELGPHTRVRLDRTDAQQHHLSLEEGTMHARVNAPPRLFAVSTAGAEVTDLGCEYTIAVDASGAGTISVQAGKVELATHSGAVVVAPVNTHATILPGQQPGVPVGPGASAALVAAVHDYERGVPGAFERVLAAATVPDAITLVAIGATDPPHRAAVLARLAEISPPPDGVTVATAAADPAALGAWRDDIVDTYVGLWSKSP
jgi:hypothetical protein